MRWARCGARAAGLALGLAVGCARPAPPPEVETPPALSLPERIALLVADTARAAAPPPPAAPGRTPADSAPGDSAPGDSLAAVMPLRVAAADTALPFRRLARLSADSAYRLGLLAGRQAAAAGADLLVVPGPEVGAGGATWPVRQPEAAGRALGGYVRGLQTAGVGAAVQLFAARDDAPAARWDRARLEAVELPFLRTLLAARPAALLVGEAVLPALSGDTLPASLAPALLSGLLRRDLGWEGVLAVHVGSASRALPALRAGADLLLGSDDRATLVAALAAAHAAGALRTERIGQSSERVLAIRQRFRADMLPPADLTPLRRPTPAPAPPVSVPPDTALLAARPADSLRADTLRRVEPAAVGMSARALARVDDVLQRAVADGLIPGAALAVGRRGGLVRLRGYGSLGAPHAEVRASATTLYDLASLTKVAATTAAVMALVDDGRLELDAPVQRYLPEWEGRHKERVTVRHLLTHTSGLPASAWLFDRAASPAEARNRVHRAALLAPPGRRVLYSDFGFILLAEVVEQVAEMPIDRYLAGRVYAPLGMGSTLFLPPLALRAEAAPSLRAGERPYPLVGEVHDANAFRLGGVVGHAGLFSTARDLAVFAQTLLDGGRYGGVRVFGAATVARFRQRQVEERALGWDMPGRVSSAGEYFSARSFGHTGYTGTSLWIDPQNELFVVLLTNRTLLGTDRGEMLALRQQVHDAVARAITDRPPPSRIRKPTPKRAPRRPARPSRRRG